MTGNLDITKLTDKQWMLVASAILQPSVILEGRSQTMVAHNLQKNGWGDIREGVSGEKIFRLNSEPWCRFNDHGGASWEELHGSRVST